MKEILSDIVFTKEEIAKSVENVAQQINKDYAGEKVVAICVLKGAFVFFSDLVRHLDLDLELDFVRIASYGSDMTSNKAISFTKDVEISLAGKHVLVVEDIVDTGNSMRFLMHQMHARGALSVKCCSFIDKCERREFSIKIDYSCFNVDAGFIVGYGLDYAERYRELPDIRTLVLED